MRLIDADALINAVNGLPTIQNHPHDMVMLSKDLIVKVIKIQPTVPMRDKDGD